MIANQKLRIAYMGTPDFAVPALRALLFAGHDVCCVYAQPPRAKGRGHQVQKSPVQLAAEQENILVRTPASLKTEEAQAEIAALHLDFAVVAAYGLILPKAILQAPKYGCINIHASCLPRWRGAAPIQRAILAGDTQTGITIMQMEEGLDTGAMWMTQTVPITPATTTQTLHNELSALGGQMIAKVLEGIVGDSLIVIQQPANSVTYAEKLKKEEGHIRWDEEAEILDRKVRALNPWPSVYFTARGETIKILQAEWIKGMEAAPATLLDNQLTIACGKDALKLIQVQRAGKAPVDGRAFLNGFSLKIGEKLV